MIFCVRHECDDNDLPSLSLFSKIWQRDFKFLKIPTHTQLGQCNICCELTELMKTSKGQALKDARERKKRHAHVVRKERYCHFMLL